MSGEIVSKLERLGEYVQILRGYQQHSLEELRSDHTLRGAVERYLELALECALDIGELVISREGLRKPETYRDVIEILGEAGVLSAEFVEKFAPAASFRNILVHRYYDIDLARLYSFLQTSLEDFDTFSKSIAVYLKK